MGKKESQPAPSRVAESGSKGVTPRPPVNIRKPEPPPPPPPPPKR